MGVVILTERAISLVVYNGLNSLNPKRVKVYQSFLGRFIFTTRSKKAKTILSFGLMRETS